LKARSKRGRAAKPRLKAQHESDNGLSTAFGNTKRRGGTARAMHYLSFRRDSMDTTFTKLAEPFDPNDIEWRAGATNRDKSQALALAYITSRAVMNRLDNTVGPENWQDDFRAGPDGGVLAGIGIRFNDEWIWKWDGAENSNIEAVKGGLSDAFKRAAVKWGIGRYLYGLDGVWVTCEQRGNTTILTGTPKLPAWALPGNKKTPATTTAETTNGKKPAGASEEAKRDILWAATIKTKNGTLLNDQPTDKLHQLLTTYATRKDKGMEIDTVDLDIIAATELLIANREKK
jgi:hypothetical protein